MDEDLKKRIVIENFNLPTHGIKKILKKRWPNTRNEDVEKLISGIDKKELQKDEGER